MRLSSLLVLAKAALLVAVFSSGACGGGGVDPFAETVATPVDKSAPVQTQIDAFVAANGLTDVRTTPSGVTYSIIEPGGEEKPTRADRITIHYHGYLVDGKTFDRTTGAPRTFPLSGLIPAWQEAIPLIGRGGVIRLLAPPSTAYGNNPPAGTGITQSSVLVFDIALEDF